MPSLALCSCEIYRRQGRSQDKPRVAMRCSVRCFFPTTMHRRIRNILSTGGTQRKSNSNTQTEPTEPVSILKRKERTSQDDKTAKLVVTGLQGHFFPFGGGAYRCPGESFARHLTLSTVPLMLRMLEIELVDTVEARKVTSHYARYPLGDHRFDKKVPIRVRKRTLA